MQKTLILYTGGTIGMDYGVNGLAPVKGLLREQLDTLDVIKDMAIDLFEYDELIDSSDINIVHWQKMVQDIKHHYDEYNGFVIIHGTDTMAYTASVLAFALRGLDKPVILTGSQLPLIHKRSDGWNNLIDALFAAGREDLHEVAIAFNNKLLRGCRAQKVSTYRFFGFDSVDASPLAEFGIQINWLTKYWQQSARFSFVPVDLNANIKILDLSLRPGYTTEFIAQTLETTNADAVILQTYGSGNIPISNQRLIAAITSAIARDIIIVNITQVNEGSVSNDYAAGQLFQLGIVNGRDMTTEAALAKLLILKSLAVPNEKIKHLIDKNLIGELNEN